MSDNPLLHLLRGCKTAHSVPNDRTSTPSPAAPSATLPRELDFFNDSQPTRSARKPHVNRSSPPIKTRTSFSSILDHAPLEQALVRLNITQPTAIQRRAIPHIINGFHVVGIAPTGSGKTLAYVLPIIRDLMLEDRDRQEGAPRAVILAPTRELAMQIGRVIERVSEVAKARLRLKVVCSKAAVAGMKGAMGKSVVDIVVGTPLRVGGLVKEGGIQVGLVKWMVLDEGDELLDERFMAQVDDVMHAVEGKVLLFSATITARCEGVIRGVMGGQEGVKRVVIGGGVMGGGMAVGASVEQRFLFVGGRGEQGKVMAVRGMLRSGEVKAPILVFVQSQDRAGELFRELVYDGVGVEVLHGGRSEAERERVVGRFREGKVWVLIATDVLARGVDFLGVNCVVNYDVPGSGRAYLHRIGRTGRNGRPGVSITLFTEEDWGGMGEVFKVAKACGAKIPEWGMRLIGGRKDVAKRLERRPVGRGKIGGPNRASLGKAKRGKRKKRPETEHALQGDGSGDLVGEGDAKQAVETGAKTELTSEAKGTHDNSRRSKWNGKKRRRIEGEKTAIDEQSKGTPLRGGKSKKFAQALAKERRDVDLFSV